MCMRAGARIKCAFAPPPPLAAHRELGLRVDRVGQGLSGPRAAKGQPTRRLASAVPRVSRTHAIVRRLRSLRRGSPLTDTAGGTRPAPATCCSLHRVTFASAVGGCLRVCGVLLPPQPQALGARPVVSVRVSRCVGRVTVLRAGAACVAREAFTVVYACRVVPPQSCAAAILDDAAPLPGAARPLPASASAAAAPLQGTRSFSRRSPRRRWGHRPFQRPWEAWWGHRPFQRPWEAWWGVQVVGGRWERVARLRTA